MLHEKALKHARRSTSAAASGSNNDAVMLELTAGIALHVQVKPMENP